MYLGCRPILQRVSLRAWPYVYFKKKRGDVVKKKLRFNIVTSYDDCAVKSRYGTGWRHRLGLENQNISPAYRLELFHPSGKISYPGNFLPPKICNWRGSVVTSTSVNKCSRNNNMLAPPAAGQQHNTSNTWCISSRSTEPYYNDNGTAVCSAYTGRWRGSTNAVFSPVWGTSALRSWAYDTRYQIWFIYPHLKNSTSYHMYTRVIWSVWCTN